MSVLTKHVFSYIFRIWRLRPARPFLQKKAAQEKGQMSMNHFDLCQEVVIQFDVRGDGQHTGMVTYVWNKGDAVPRFPEPADQATADATYEARELAYREGRSASRGC